MGKFEIRYGVLCGFGCVCDWEDCDACSLDDARNIAYKLACQEYEKYDGMFGLRSIGDILKDGDASDKEEAEEIWREERSSWLEYDAREKKSSSSKSF